MAKIKENVILQADGNEANVEDIVARAKESFVADGHKASEVKNIVVYMKSEENAAYYVINDEFTGKVALF